MQKPKPPTATSPDSERLRFSTAILRLLGEELNPSPDQGILELIKNSYDADARTCTVELKGIHIAGGSIRLLDDGAGMTADDIRNGWLIVGDSMKSRSETSPSGRLLVGSKGLGRLGALRLGKRVTLVTRPKSERGVQYRVEIDWTAFHRVRVVEEVELSIIKEKALKGAHYGTEIVISELPSPWRESDIKRLARAILLLRDPFSQERGFRATLKVKEFRQLEKLAKAGYFSECDFHLIAKIDEEGRASAVVKSAGGRRLFVGKHQDVSTEKAHPIYAVPALTFELWEFNLSSKGFAVSTKQTTLKDLRTWLEQFGGVKLYHRGVRVLPYGEPKNDWLDMNLRRSQHQELRPSTNNSVGCVRIEDRVGVLQQKTDRLGFVESTAFEELRRFTDDALDWMAGRRRVERDRRKKAEAERIANEKTAAENGVTAAIGDLPPAQRKEVEAAVSKLKSAHEAEVEMKDDTTQLYFTLGTIGTTAAAFAHQTKQPIRGILNDASTLESFLGDADQFPFFREQSSALVKRINREANGIYSFSAVTLRLLEHEKRRSARHSIRVLIEETIDLLRPYLDVR